MYRVMMIVDGESYEYGIYEHEQANEVAMQIRDAREIDTYVEEV